MNSYYSMPCAPQSESQSPLLCFFGPREQKPQRINPQGLSEKVSHSFQFGEPKVFKSITSNVTVLRLQTGIFLGNFLKKIKKTADLFDSSRLLWTADIKYSRIGCQDVRYGITNQRQAITQHNFPWRNQNGVISKRSPWLHEVMKADTLQFCSNWIFPKQLTVR